MKHMLCLKQTQLLLYTNFKKEKKNVGNCRNIWPEVGYNHLLQETWKAAKTAWEQ